jgi:hypothetical protein
MNAKLIRWLLTACCALLAACAIITVNVYFPEEGAKQAYKSLDDMLLKNSADKAPKGDSKPGAEKAEPSSKLQFHIFKDLSAFSFVGVAHADDKFGDDLAVELAGMPEVNKAYDEMNKRLPRLTTLFNSGAVGLTSQGLVTVRDKSGVNAQDEALVNAENQSRKVVITSMAKAIVKLTKQADTKAVLDQMLGKAAATYAETKRDAARPGWWMQLANGRWVQK